VSPPCQQARTATTTYEQGVYKVSSFDAWLDGLPEWLVFLVAGSCLAAMWFVPFAVAVYR
jgi:hypothetical protein